MKVAGLSNSLSDNAGFSYISGNKCEGFGSARKNCKKRRGIRGYCKYTYCIIVNGIPQKFDDDDYQVKSKLEDEYLGTSYKEQKYARRRFVQALSCTVPLSSSSVLCRALSRLLVDFTFILFYVII